MGLGPRVQVLRGLAAIVVLALVLSACSPEPPYDQFLDAPNVFAGQVRMDVTREAPMTVRDIEISVDPATGGGSTRTSVRAKARVDGVRFTLASDAGRPAVSHVSSLDVTVSRESDGCESAPCIVRLIAELTDPGLAGAAVNAELEIRAMPANDKESLAADAMTVSVTDPGPSAVHRAVVQRETSGEEVLDADHPLVELNLSASFEPGTVRARGMLLGDARLVVEGLDGAPPMVDIWTPTQEFEHYADAISVVLGVVQCNPGEPCQAKWAPQLVASRDTVEPIHIRWRFLARLVDYAVDAAPADRAVKATTTVINRVRPDARAIVRTVSGTMQMTSSGQHLGPWYVVAPNAVLANLSRDGRVRLVMTDILTMTAVQGSGQSVSNELIREDALRFAADGQPHTDRSNHLIVCSEKSGFYCSPRAVVTTSIWAPDSAATSPITIEWTHEVRLTVLGDFDLPAEASFDIVAATP